MNLSRRHLLFAGGAATASLALARVLWAQPSVAAPAAAAGKFAVTHSDGEWQRLLTPNQYAVLRRAGTERPFTSPLNDEHRDGVFACAGCALDLFAAQTKFDSGTGWPSFWKPLDGAVLERPDDSYGMHRVEALCSRCGGHLGHVFNDGPPPTGLRYCMNGVAMTFRPA